MKKIIFILLFVFPIGTSFANTSEPELNAHRFANNTAAVSHVEAFIHKKTLVNVNKDIDKPFSAMNEHERAIVAISFMKNSSSYAQQQMIEYHKKMLKQTVKKTEPISYSDLSAAASAH